MSEHSLHWWDRVLKWINRNKISRMRLHYTALCAHLNPKTPSAAAEVEFFQKKFEYYYKRAQRLSTIRTIFVIILGASILIKLLQLVPFLSFLVELLQFVSTIFGSVAAAIVLVLNTQINFNLQLMGQALSHIVALYTQNTKRDTKKVLQQLNKTL